MTVTNVVGVVAGGEDTPTPGEVVTGLPLSSPLGKVAWEVAVARVNNCFAVGKRPATIVGPGTG